MITETQPSELRMVISRTITTALELAAYVSWTLTMVAIDILQTLRELDTPMAQLLAKPVLQVMLQMMSSDSMTYTPMMMLTHPMTVLMHLIANTHLTLTSLISQMELSQTEVTITTVVDIN